MTTESGDVFTADWVLGADGSNSQVRQTAGFTFEGMTYPERFLVASTTEDLESVLPGIAAVNYVFDPTEWLVVLRTPEHWRILFPTDQDTPDEVEIDPARIQARLAGVADLGRPWDVLHTTLYRVHQRVADTFRKDRLILMGDAAHINNPLGGMGMNSGLHDAVVEATALLALLDGTGSRGRARRGLRGTPPGGAVVRQDHHARQLGAAAPDRPGGAEGLPRRAARAGRRSGADARPTCSTPR